MNLEVLVLPVFNGYYVESGSVREHQASRFLSAKKASGITACARRGHPSFLLFTHLACNVTSHVPTLKPAGSHWGQKPNHSGTTSASEQQTHAAEAYSTSSTSSLSAVFMCQKLYLCSQLSHSEPSSTLIPATCPGRRWPCWAWTRRRGSSPSTPRW